jgi:hypothetical protein
MTNPPQPPQPPQPTDLDNIKRMLDATYTQYHEDYEKSVEKMSGVLPAYILLTLSTSRSADIFMYFTPSGKFKGIYNGL